MKIKINLTNQELIFNIKSNKSKFLVLFLLLF